MFNRKIYYLLITCFILAPVMTLAQEVEGASWQQSYLIWKKRQQEVRDFVDEKKGLRRNEINIKTLLLHSKTTGSILETVILFLENIKNKINSAVAGSQLDNEMKNKYIKDIDDLTNSLKRYEVKIVKSDNLASLQETIFEIRKQWFEIQRVSRQATGRLNVVKWQSLHDRFSSHLVGVEEKIELLDEEQYDKNKLDERLSQVRDYLDKFSRELIIAKQVFDSTITVNNSDQLYQEGIKSLRQMSRYLFSVKDILLEINSIINQTKNIDINGGEEQSTSTPIAN